MAQQSAPSYSSLLHPLNPPLSFSFTFQSDTMQLFYLFFLNTKHHCLLNFWWWLKSKKSQKHLSIKTSQAEFRCSSPELHPYSKDIASCLFPSSQLFLLSCCYWGQKARLKSRTHKQTCTDLYKVLAAWKIGCKPDLYWTRYPKTWRLCYPGKVQLISILSPFVLNCWSKWARDKSNMDGLYGWCLSIPQCLWGWEAKATWKGWCSGVLR